MFDILIIILLLVLNGIFAMCEIALVSSRKSKLEHIANKGNHNATIALNLLKEPEKFLSTIQIGITLIGIIAGAYGGEAFTKDLLPVIEKISWLKNYAEEVSFTIIIITITFFSLIIGELVPKSIALNNPEKIAVYTAPFMQILSFITYPFVLLLSISTKIFIKTLMIKENNEPPVTEDELKYMIETGSKHGIIEQQESEMLYGIFRFGDKTAENIMTRRQEIIWINKNQSKDEILANVYQANCTKFPVCSNSIDNILGVVSLRDIVTYAKNEMPFNLQEHLIEPLFFPANTPALKILDTFRKTKIHIGFIVNEYGDTIGLITLHDLIENIIGELPELDDVEEIKIIERADGSWLVDGNIDIIQLKKLLKIDNLLHEKNYITLAGFTIQQLHKIPKTGDNFTFQNYKFEIIDMDGNKIDKVLISKLN